MPVPVGAVLTQSGGTLAGAGTLSVAGSLAWSFGTQTGAGTTRILPGASLALTSASTKTLQGGRTLRNEGTTTWENGPIVLWAAPAGLRTVIDNAGLFEVRSDFDVSETGGIGDSVFPLIRNTGTFSKTAGGGETQISSSVTFDNDGTVAADSGTLSLLGGGSATGSFAGTAAGTLVRFATGSYTLENGASLSGRVELGSGTLTIPGGTTVPVPVGAVLTQSGGTLAGVGTLSVAGSLAWSLGTQTGAGTTRILPGASLALTSASTKTLQGGRTLRNEGTTTWENGPIVLWAAPAGLRTVIDNAGLFEVRSDFDVSETGGIGDSVFPLIRNTGTFSKTAGGGETQISSSVTFDNDGTVAADSGTLDLGELASFSAASHTLSRGTYLVSSTLQFGGADIFTNAAKVVLDGPASKIVDQSGADALRHFATNASAGDFTIANGKILTTTGAFANSGTLTVGLDSTFTSTGDYNQTAGTTRLATATSNLTATAAAVNVTGGSLTGVGTAGPSVNAIGGEVSPGLSPGILHASGAYAQSASGALRVEIGGTTAGTQFDQLQVAGAATLSGTLRVDTVGGFVPAAGDRFRIVTAGQRSGEFLSLSGADIGGGRAYTAEYDATGVTLVVSNVSLSIGDAQVTEGDGGTAEATFTVTLATPRTVPVSVQYATVDGTAASADYTASSGTLTFAPGETEKTVSVSVKGDTLDEDDETFFVNLSTADQCGDREGSGGRHDRRRRPAPVALDLRRARDRGEQRHGGRGLQRHPCAAAAAGR